MWRSLLVAVAATVVALCGAAPAHAADPVVTSIWKARKAGGIDSETSRRYQSLWRNSARAARRLSRQGHAGRAAQVRGARAIALDLGRRRRLNAPRLAAVLSSVRATTYVMRKREFPAYEERVRVPGDPLVYAYFSGRGVQFHPLATFAWGNTLYATRQDEQLRALAERLLELAVRRGSFHTWEYQFPYGGGRAPWISGMAQAVGMQVMARAWERTGDERFLVVARRALNAFTVPASRGGVTADQGDGTWYLLYDFRSRQRVLNGHLQALLGLHEYHRITSDELAEERWQAGLSAVLPILRRFDTGAWSRYDLYSEANLNYHDLMTKQLSRLGRRRGVTEFSDLAFRFATYRTTPPVIVVPVQRLLPIYPRKDGYRDRTAFRFFIDKRSSVTVTIRNQEGKTVRRMWASGPRGRRRLTWDGRNGRGRIVKAGSYTVRIVARDLVGNRRTGELTGALRVTGPGARKPRRVSRQVRRVTSVVDVASR